MGKVDGVAYKSRLYNCPVCGCGFRHNTKPKYEYAPIMCGGTIKYIGSHTVCCNRCMDIFNIAVEKACSLEAAYLLWKLELESEFSAYQDLETIKMLKRKLRVLGYPLEGARAISLSHLLEQGGKGTHKVGALTCAI